MSEDREQRYDPDGYMRARVDFLAQNIAELRASLGQGLQELKTEATRQEERLRHTVMETEKRSLERMGEMQRGVVEQNMHMQETLRQDRAQLLGVAQRVEGMQKTIFMVMGGLGLLVFLANFLRPLWEKMLK